MDRRCESAKAEKSEPRVCVLNPTPLSLSLTLLSLSIYLSLYTYISTHTLPSLFSFHSNTRRPRRLNNSPTKKLNSIKVRKCSMTSDAKRKTSKPSCPIVCLQSYSNTARHAILCVSVLLLLVSQAGAQNGQSPDQYPSYKNFSPSMAAIIVILIAALFFMGFFSIYIRNCSQPAADGSARRNVFGASWRRGVAPRGLDQAVIDTFPTFVYSAVKGLKIGNGALECAVCLNEFEGDETLRLIPKCDHVFHPECIDAWLGSHVTCPVCRANLVPQPGETFEIPELFPELNNDSAETRNEEVSIRVVEDPELPQVVDRNRSVREPPLPPQTVDRNRSVSKNRPPRSRSVRQKLFAKFPRSHSTGHSLVQPGENTDRFTLRLPEDVRKQVMSRALNRTTSCVALPRVASSRRGYRTGLGEESSRGWRSYRRPERLDRLGNSDRWVFSMAPPFFSRASSVRSPKVVAADGEGSTSLGSASFKRVDRKGEEAGASTDSDRPTV